MKEMFAISNASFSITASCVYVCIQIVMILLHLFLMYSESACVPFASGIISDYFSKVSGLVTSILSTYTEYTTTTPNCTCNMCYACTCTYILCMYMYNSHVYYTCMYVLVFTYKIVVVGVTALCIQYSIAPGVYHTHNIVT